MNIKIDGPDAEQALAELKSAIEYDNLRAEVTIIKPMSAFADMDARFSDLFEENENE